MAANGAEATAAAPQGARLQCKLWRGDREEDLEAAAAALRAGLPVAFPTETVYGLGALAADDVAVTRVFAAKGRPSDNPLIVHFADGLLGLREVAENGYVPPAALALAEAFWPGPLSLCIRANPAAVGEKARAGLPTVAVRVPSHPVALALLRKVGGGVAAPSANASGRPSPTSAAHVLEDLSPGGLIAGVVEAVGEGAACDVGYESTVLDCSVTPPAILRPGKVSKEQIEAVLGYSLAGDVAAAGTGEAPKAPGMKYRHYAPQARVEIVELPSGVLPSAADVSNPSADGLLTDSGREHGRDAFLDTVLGALRRGETVGAMAPGDMLQDLRIAVVNEESSNGHDTESGVGENGAGEGGGAGVVRTAGGGVAVLVQCGSRCGEVDSIGRELFGALRAFDSHPVKVPVIFALGVQSHGPGAAILNRLRKAAAKDADEAPSSAQN